MSGSVNIDVQARREISSRYQGNPMAPGYIVICVLLSLLVLMGAIVIGGRLYRSPARRYRRRLRREDRLYAALMARRHKK